MEEMESRTLCIKKNEEIKSQSTCRHSLINMFKNIYVTNHQSKGFYKIFNETARSIVHLFSWQQVKEGS